MGGQGTFSEPRLNLNITNGTEDLVTGKLPALQAYQLSLTPPPAGSFDATAAALFTDANTTLHPASDSMAEPETPSYASRSATTQYRSSPLKGVWQHAPYFHDGSAATLSVVVTTYNTRLAHGLSAAQIADLAEYLKSL